MRTLVFLVILLTFVTACKKKYAGKHCPLVIETYTGHLVDVSGISWMPQIRDTLAKYPQLQVYRTNFAKGVYDTNSYSANISCHIYHKGLVIFNTDYYLYVTNSIHDSLINTLNRSLIPSNIDVSPDPAVSLERANEIAEQAVHFEYCTISRLGFLNAGTKSSPDYKLIWRIKAAETGYPIVEIDAASGDILQVVKDNIIID